MSEPLVYSVHCELNVSQIVVVLVSGWSDNGWLSGGHAVRMAMELCKSPIVVIAIYHGFAAVSITDILDHIAMHKAWPELLNRMKHNQISVTKDQELVIASRTWFCLYLFEHQ